MYNRYLKAFSLIEVLVAVAIVSVSLVVLFHTFSIAIQGIKATQDYTKAKFLLERKMSDFEISGIPDDVKEEFTEFSHPFSDFKWKVEVEDDIVRGIDLDKVILTVQLPETSDNRIIKTVTYFK